jgi:hypothetical protein
MEPAPQGGVIVASFPATAGRRGRQPRSWIGGYDWDEIVTFLKARPMTKAYYPNVPSGGVGELRTRYPECRFTTYHVHMEQSDQRDKPRKVCTVGVQWTGAGDDGTEIES